MRIKIKICGITNKTDARNAVKMGAEALGFVFFKPSPRHIRPADARKIIQTIPPFVSRVGVFVNEKPRIIRKIAIQCGLDTLQFHGEETNSYCQKFPGYKIIKAFRIKDASSLKDIGRYRVDGFLLDTYSRRSYGGTGESFNWKLLEKLSNKIRPLILSGGINPKNVVKAVKKVRPYAVDVSSGVESGPGKKSFSLLKEFFAALKRGNC